MDTNTNSYFSLGSNLDTNSAKVCRILVSVLFTFYISKFEYSDSDIVWIINSWFGYELSI